MNRIIKKSVQFEPHEFSPFFDYAKKCVTMFAAAYPILTREELQTKVEDFDTIMAAGFICGDSAVATVRKMVVYCRRKEVAR